MNLPQSEHTDFNPKDAVDKAKDNPGYSRSLTWQQRLMVTNYLNSIKYNYPENDPPRLDKSVFSTRSRK